MVKVPPNEWFDQSGYTPGCPACGALELGVNPDGLTHSNECIDQFEKLLKGSPADLGDSMKVCTSGPSVMVDTSIFIYEPLLISSIVMPSSSIELNLDIALRLGHLVSIVYIYSW